MSKKSRSAVKLAEDPSKPKDPTKDTSPYVFQRDKISFDISVRELPWTEKQKQLISLVLDKTTRCVFIEGPAGCSKTSTAVFTGLQLLKAKKASDIIFVRSAVESADSKIGYLPGTIDEKFEAYMAPFVEKMEEFLDSSTIKRLHNDQRVSAMPVNYIRGLHWPAKVIIVDECQNITFRELVTTITRLGEFSKIIFLGDPYQSDLPSNKSGGFTKICNLFDCEASKAHGIHHFKFTKEDIVRSEFVKFVVGKLEDHEAQKHEMFPSEK
jgi:phosphate starvation-inducible PhoH-like protein